MKIALPNFAGDVAQYTRSLAQALVTAFNQIPSGIEPGMIVLWTDGIALPAGYLLCDGSSYEQTDYPALSRILPPSAPGLFETPNIVAPSGAVAMIRV